jgi:hypothetical protein
MAGTANFSNGLSSFGVPILGSGTLPVTTGKYFFVSSGTGANGASYINSPKKPFATIDYAIGKCTANKGDVIVVMPGHAETLSTAGAITADVAGVTIVGLGSGTFRPTLTLSATDATILVSAANVTFTNLRIATGVAELVTAFSVSGSDCTIQGCRFLDSSTFTFISAITGAATALRLNIKGNTAYTSVTPTGTAAWISVSGAAHGLTVEDNEFYLARANSAVSAAIGTLVAASYGAQIHRNNLVCVGGASSLVISLYAGTTGQVTYNNLGCPKTAIAGINAIASCYGAQNFVNNTVNTDGLLDPVVDS